MRVPRSRLTIGRIMVAIALVAVALVALPEPAFVLRLPATGAPPVVLPDGTIVTAMRPEINVTRFGAVLIVSALGAIVLVAAWLVKRLLRLARRSVAADPQ
jgi:hypothetical protein